MPELLQPVRREWFTRLPAAEAVMRALLVELTARDRETVPDSVLSAIPDGTELIGLNVENGVADVNLSGEFELANAEIVHVFRIAQVVFTLTELREIELVRFRIHGVHQPVVGQDGVTRDVVGRGNYSRYGPKPGTPPLMGAPIGTPAPSPISSPTPTP